jgi:ADP-heptose:LPS heptosyltransferase
MPKQTILRWLDRNAAALLCTILANTIRRRCQAIPFDFSSVGSIVVVKFCCLGDAILMGPALRAIRAAYPNARITIVTTSKTSGVFASIAQVDRIVELPLSPNPSVVIRALRDAVPGRPDLLYCFEPWYPTATLVSHWLRPSHSIGFTSPRASYNRALFDLAVPYREDQHVVETYRGLAEAGIPVTLPKQPLGLAIDASAEERVSRFFSDENLGSDVVALFAAGSPTWLRKRWPTSHFARLADSLVSDFGFQVLLLTGRGQESVNRAVLSQMRERAAVTPGDFSVAELAAVIRKCRLLVSSDSSPIHIASAVGTAVVALFGPAPAITYRPYLPSPTFRVINKNLPCSPCLQFAQSPPCPIEFECIQSITVTEVLRAVRQIVESDSLPESRQPECTL